ncbi:hypothetical protein HWV07_18810 [Natronomonas salina]|uniref:hypothetical protein n=1 Tax=Natronomonas salina TaxID=1710540 RepID=UPI0015B45C5C|nr:hypothetical protein [Natronomonas salina]QLD90986.1 hypothetical protein HWV07_18810 [Natronomonas salina]
MSPTTLILAGLVLLLTVGIGTVVHELLHAAVLRASGVDYELQWLHGEATGRLGAGVFGTWASVELRAVPADLAPWRLRAASLAPLLLATPLVAVAAGVVPDPFAGDAVVLQLAVVGWLACSLPSPQDFSMVWHAETVLSEGHLPVADGA